MDKISLRTSLSALGLWILLGMTPAAYAASTVEMMNAFQALSPEQQQQLRRQYQGQLPGAPVATDQPLPAPEIQPRAVKTTAVEVAASVPVATEPAVPVSQLKPFGYDLFAGEPTTFAPVTDAPVPQGYTLGPGDVLQIQVLGKDPADYRLPVSRQGSISFPQLGPISVVGQTFDEVKALIASQVASQMIGAKINVSLAELRTMRVFVLGDAYRPGSYSISGLSSISNALFVSGGVRGNGSLRSIQLKRNGKLIKTLDLYDFLLQGDNSRDQILQDGDVVFIPPVGPRVWVSGEVNRPAIYELKGRETLAQTLRLAGGTTSLALTTEVQISRVDANKRRLLGIDLSEKTGQARQIENGDQIRVPSILNLNKQQIHVKGYISRPGTLPLNANMRLSQVVSLNDLRPQTDLDFAVLRRTRASDSQYQLVIVDLAAALRRPGSDADLLLQANDELVLLSLKQSRSAQLVEVLGDIDAQTGTREPRPVVGLYGHVRNPGRYPFQANMKLAQLLDMARGTGYSGDLYPHFGIIEQSDPNSYVSQYRAFNPADVLAQQASIELTPESRVFLFSKADIQFLSSATIKQALQGGGADQCRALESLTTLAGSERAARLLSLTAANSRHEPCSEVFSLEAALLPFMLEYSVALQGEVLDSGLYPVIGATTLGGLTRFAGGATTEADLNSVELMRYSAADKALLTRVLRLPEQAAEPLLAGDVITLRPVDNGLESGTVAVSGEVKYPGSYQLRRGETLSQLLARTGGLTEQAYPYGAIFSRASVKQQEQRAYQRAQEELRNGLFTTLSSGRMALAGNANSSSMQLYMTLLNQINRATPLGRVVIEADPSLLEVRPELDILLQPGDALVMPKRPSSVSVAGQVLNPSSLQFRPGMQPAEYLALAGGETQAADMSRVFVVLPNGTAKPLKLSAWSFTDQNIPPGSSIVVPRDLLPFDPLIMTTAVTDILSKVAITAASLNAISN